ncbi:Aspartate--tRNA ligase, mitochondrial [Frankliniella fusca]|uniref:Aspartate--tRNA ligase, mitochondrial n=1 Tax=Frankliniella fusca TaxID=407009 RepID=A0AAE1H0B7_9NEOP|nr:Aspartate--tRNA ligase, mitochondrial [Frankliniella fusca]
MMDLTLYLLKGSSSLVRFGGVLPKFSTVMKRHGKVLKIINEYSSSSSLSSLSHFEAQRTASNDKKSCFTTRTHTCGELTSKDIGCKVRVKGWIQYNRSKFLLLRDAYGMTQVLVEEMNDKMRQFIDGLPLESVIEVNGEVIARPKDQINNKMVTGDIEIKASDIRVLGAAPKQMPLQIKEKKLPTEDIRMKYRYLYLRYPHMQKTLRLRSQLFHSMREFLIQHHFVDVETPTLFRKTPGGAQEFVVPTQIPGHFYSLVQSPQQFKQLLMIGGLDRYFQIARCYRDETVRHDRQPEFTQLDIELSFVEREDIIKLIEELLKFSWPTSEERPDIPFLQMTFHDAMLNYGSDKPDLRFESKICDVTHLLNPQKNASICQQEVPGELSARAIIFPKAASVCKKDHLKEIKTEAMKNTIHSDLHMVPIKKFRDIKNSLQSVLSVEEINKIVDFLKVVEGDLLCLCIGKPLEVLKVLGLARVLTADALEANGFMVREVENRFLWIVDFPLFEESGMGSLLSAHHPFTQPHPDDMHLLESEPLKVRGLHYDLVLNGSEIGGGSIRISDAHLQKYILNDLLHLDTSTLQHLIDGLSLGCPPHGGIALGLDRLVAMICGVKSIREVIAFPKGLKGKDPMAGAPAPLTKEDAETYKLPFSHC